jgi:electron transport complex protein RnfG
MSTPFRQHIAYHGLLLGGLALVAGSLLAFGSRVTYPEIAQREAEDLKGSLSQVVPDAMHDNDMLADTLEVTGPDGAPMTVYRANLKQQVSAVAFALDAYGYAGTPIRLIMGIDSHGTILGVRVLSHAETPGLGDKIETAKGDWILSFSGKSLDDPGEKGWGVKKDGGIFDQFTGATITPRGVVRGVHKGLAFFHDNRNRLLTAVGNAKAVRPKKRKRDE